MAGTFSDNVINDSIRAEGTGEGRAAVSSNSWGVFRWFIIIGSLALAAELIWFLGVTPFRPFSRIEINGFSYYDNDSLLSYAGINAQSSFILTNAHETEALLAALPYIDSVRVYKRFPGRLEINLQGRRASAFAFASSEGVTVPVLFDSHGVIFQIGADDVTGTLTDIPVISGLIIEQPVLGMRLPARFHSLLEGIDSIRINAPELLSAISEIRIDRQSSEGFDLTVFLLHHNMRVRLSALNEEILRYTLLIADVLALRDPEIDLIDFRGSIASYFPKGGYL